MHRFPVLLRVLVWTAYLLAGALPAGAGHADTLAEAVARSLATFPDVRSSAANRRAVSETLEQARAQRLPSIDGTLAQGRERSDNPATRAAGAQANLGRGEAEVTLSQLLFDGGAVSSQVRRQEARSESASQQFSGVAESVALRVAQAFFEVLRLRQLIDIAGENVAAHRRSLEQVSVLVESGAGRRVDERQAAARLALAQALLVVLRGQLEQAETAYRHLTSRFPGPLVRPALTGNALPGSLPQGVEQALAQHPSILAAKLEREAAFADLEFTRSRLSPRLTLELGLTQNHDIDGIRGLNADRIAMLRLRHNFYRGGADASRVREAEARRDEAQALLARAQNDVEREVRQAWENLAAERERLPQLQLHARASAEVVDAYRAQFKIGQRSLLDVLNAESEHFSARSSVVSGEHAVAAGAYRLLASLGRLLATLGVAPPENTPSALPGAEAGR